MRRTADERITPRARGLGDLAAGSGLAGGGHRAPVRAGAPVDAVDARATVDTGGPAAGRVVVARTAAHVVAAVAPVDEVVAALAGDAVVTDPPVQVVVARSALEDVVA